MKLIITLDIDPRDRPADEVADRIRNRKDRVGYAIVRAAIEAAEEATWAIFVDDDYRQPHVRGTSRVVR
jgi:hypothetical protein